MRIMQTNSFPFAFNLSDMFGGQSGFTTPSYELKISKPSSCDRLEPDRSERSTTLATGH